MSELNQAVIENRLNSFEDAIKKNIELSTRSIELSTQLLSEVKRTNDTFITHVEYIHRDYERVSKDVTHLSEDIKELMNRVKETEVEMDRVGFVEAEVRDIRHKVNEINASNFESLANKWIQGSFGKWLIGTLAVTMGAVFGSLIHAFFLK